MAEGRRLRVSPSRARAVTAKQEEVKRTTRSSAYGNEEEENEVLERVKFPEGVEPAFVRVSVGSTYNLGNYESLRIDVSITLPCDPARVDQGYEDASAFVADKLAREESNWIGKRR